MPDRQNEHSKILGEIIRVCEGWKKHIDEKTSIGKELASELYGQDIFEILRDIV